MNGAFRESGEYTLMVRATNAHNAMQTLTTKPSSTEVMEIHAITVKVELVRHRIVVKRVAPYFVEYFVSASGRDRSRKRTTTT